MSPSSEGSAEPRAGARHPIHRTALAQPARAACAFGLGILKQCSSEFRVALGGEQRSPSSMQLFAARRAGNTSLRPPEDPGNILQAPVLSYESNWLTASACAERGASFQPALAEGPIASVPGNWSQSERPDDSKQCQQIPSRRSGALSYRRLRRRRLVRAPVEFRSHYTSAGSAPNEHRKSKIHV